MATGIACADRKQADSCCPMPGSCAISAGTSQYGRTTRFRLARRASRFQDGSSNRVAPDSREILADTRERVQGGSCSRAPVPYFARAAASTNGHEQARPPMAQCQVSSAEPGLRQYDIERRSCFPPARFDRVELLPRGDVPPVPFLRLIFRKYREGPLRPPRLAR